MFSLFNSKEKKPIITLDNAIIPTPEEKWIWVDGYKGFTREYIDGKSTLCGYNSFPYNSVGEVTCLPEDPKKMNPCSWGLHFCDKLEDVFGYYDIVYKDVGWDYYLDLNHEIQAKPANIYNTIFAKVKAKVNESDYLKWKESGKDKFVARKIIITEIVSYEDIYDAYMTTHNEVKIGSEVISSKESYVAIKEALDKSGLNTLEVYNLMVEQLKKVRIESQIDNLVSHGYSETFARIIVDKYSYDDAIAYAKEGMSKDMRAYLLVKN
jgi:hypothetical protein